jgi:hypothetical protein
MRERGMHCCLGEQCVSAALHVLQSDQIMKGAVHTVCSSRAAEQHLPQGGRRWSPLLHDSLGHEVSGGSHVRNPMRRVYLQTPFPSPAPTPAGGRRKTKGPEGQHRGGLSLPTPEGLTTLKCSTPCSEGSDLFGTALPGCTPNCLHSSGCRLRKGGEGQVE